jgi:hypothetical protein
MSEPSSEDTHTAEPAFVSQELPKLAHTLDRLEATVAAGTRLAAEALNRFADPDGLLDLIDAECLSDSSFGLRAWLFDLQAAMRAGRTDDVAFGIRRWQKLARETEQAADRLKAANGTPMRYFMELRGRLSVHHIKAVSLGLAEDGELFGPAFPGAGRSPWHTRRPAAGGTIRPRLRGGGEPSGRRNPDSEAETVRRAGGGLGGRRKQDE